MIAVPIRVEPTGFSAKHPQWREHTGGCESADHPKFARTAEDACWVQRKVCPSHHRRCVSPEAGEAGTCLVPASPASGVQNRMARPTACATARGDFAHAVGRAVRRCTSLRPFYDAGGVGRPSGGRRGQTGAGKRFFRRTPSADFPCAPLLARYIGAK